MELKDSLLKKALKKASLWGNNAGEKDIENVAKNKDKMNKGPLSKVWDKVTILWKAFLDPGTPTSTKILIIGALIYMVSPIDLIPDAIFPVGLIDDAAVIVFVYTQCKAILDTYIPKIQQAGEKLITDLSDDAIEKTICEPLGKQFTAFEKRIILNSAVKLFLFCDALLILRFSQPGWIIDKYIASVLLLLIYLWLAYSIIAGTIKGIRYLSRFIPAYKETKERESQKTSDDKRLGWKDIFAEALYKAFGETALPKNYKFRKRLAAFFFRKWNEGKLPQFIPEKKEIVNKIWNTLKVRVLIFLGVFTAYILVYNILVRGILLKSVTSYTIWQLLAYPVLYSWHILFH